jgi:putative NADH-flavin reductase
MKLAIFGATGKTGIELVKQALDHGHEVTVMVRDPNRLPTFSKSLAVFTGDLSQQETVRSTIEGQDAVVCTLGSRELYKNSGLRTRGTRAIIEAMDEVGVKRLVVMSSMGIGESWNNLSLFSKALFKLVMPAAREDHEAQELAIKSSTLDWTIIRPSGLTDDPGVSKYEFGKDLTPKTSRISRANVADLILKVIESNTHVHEAITISN